MPTLSLYFHADFLDENWREITYKLEAPEDTNHHGKAGEWVLGRHPASDLTIAVRNVSRKHAAISYSYASDRWSLEDLGSDGGTFLNGRRLRPGDRPSLAIGDQIYLGSNLIAVVEDEWDTVQNERGPETVASTTPLDYRPQVIALPAPAPPAPAPPAPAPPAPAPKTHADSLYLAIEWCLTPTTRSGVAVRLLLLAVGVLVLVLWRA